MLGHVYPLWHGFRGGKGMATLVGAVLGVSPWLLLPMIVTWLVTVMISGFVGLASILASGALAVALVVTNAAAPLKAFGIAAALLVLFTHRSNIARMRAGTESRARRTASSSVSSRITWTCRPSTIAELVMTVVRASLVPTCRCSIALALLSVRAWRIGQR